MNKQQHRYFDTGVQGCCSSSPANALYPCGHSRWRVRMKEDSLVSVTATTTPSYMCTDGTDKVDGDDGVIDSMDLATVGSMGDLPIVLYLQARGDEE